MEIGAYLKGARESKCITIRELARRTGISHSYISQIENNKRSNVKKYVIKILCDALGVTYKEELDNVSNEKENNFGGYMQKVRKSKNLSLREVASRSDISQPYLSQIENKNRNAPTPDVLRKLSKGL